MARAIDDLPDDVASLKAMLLAERAAREAELAAERGRLAQLADVRDRLEARNATLEAEVDRLTAQADRLDHIISVLRRAHFGRRSERITDDQIELALEDVETGFGVQDAQVEADSPTLRADATKTRRANRGHLPKHLPREEIVIVPERTDCPCCGGDLHVIGEDVSERLDKIPARLRVIVTRRPVRLPACSNRCGRDRRIIQARAAASRARRPAERSAHC